MIHYDSVLDLTSEKCSLSLIQTVIKSADIIHTKGPAVMKTNFWQVEFS